MKLLIKNGRVIDPANGRDGQFDVLVEKGRIQKVAPQGKLPKAETDGAKEIDAKGCVVTPGFLDMHVHFREPGFEYKETIQTGCESAAAGGFTTVAMMPNTNPVNDTRSVTEFMLAQARAHGIINALPIGAITRGLKGEELTDMKDLKDAGALALSDDGRPVMSNQLMRRAFEYSRMCDLLLIQHSEILDLTKGGCMHEGSVSTELGLGGMPHEAEDIMVYRDIALLEKTGGRLHVAHISSGNSVELVRRAKKQGLPVTTEVAPHHFMLTDAAVRGYDTNTKMSPPLRSDGDIERIKEGLADGTIDMIATDHAPHDVVDKQVEYAHACFGVVGLETALPLSLKLVEEKVITLPQMVEKLTSRPAEVFRLDKGTLTEGRDADITIFDPEAEYTVDVMKFKSKSKNSPFHGWQVKGKVTHTIYRGKVVYTNPS
ncbi:dihydroorotase [Nitrospina gracilis]|uniref:dihydroorotase n=1 Tax=Nitrospina gracilis TaxID=35801 RepID=UPI001F43220A|nr:dihydroorotase [Nitrospina gracilis]MCF8720622.1 dihydroorotase [Nitrospina gracilis Nb-211]